MIQRKHLLVSSRLRHFITDRSKILREPITKINQIALLRCPYSRNDGMTLVCLWLASLQFACG